MLAIKDDQRFPVAAELIVNRTLDVDADVYWARVSGGTREISTCSGFAG